MGEPLNDNLFPPYLPRITGLPLSFPSGSMEMVLTELSPPFPLNGIPPPIAAAFSVFPRRCHNLPFVLLLSQGRAAEPYMLSTCRHHQMFVVGAPFLHERLFCSSCAIFGGTSLVFSLRVGRLSSCWQFIRLRQVPLPSDSAVLSAPYVRSFLLPATPGG